jgi:transposase InsO family protein
MSQPDSDASNLGWQFDHQPLDSVFNSDTDGQGVRPWITMLIDVYSRTPVGFHISLEPPNQADVMRSLLDCGDAQTSQETPPTDNGTLLQSGDTQTNQETPPTDNGTLLQSAEDEEHGE